MIQKIIFYCKILLVLDLLLWVAYDSKIVYSSCTQVPVSICQQFISDGSVNIIFAAYTHGGANTEAGDLFIVKAKSRTFAASRFSSVIKLATWSKY